MNEVIVSWPRQFGKTTMMKLLKEYEERQKSMTPLTELQVEAVFAYIFYATRIKVPREIVCLIKQEQVKYTGEGYQELQTYLCKELTKKKYPEFITGIGLIESAERMVLCASENLCQDEIQDGIDTCFSQTSCTDCKKFKPTIDMPERCMFKSKSQYCKIKERYIKF